MMSSSKKRKASGRINDHPRRPHRLFATLELVNRAGYRTAAHLARNYDKLSPHHQNTLRITKFEPQPPSSPEGSDESEYDTDTSDPTLSEQYLARYELLFGDVDESKQIPGLHYTLGKGSSSKGENRGVDLLLICPGKNSMGVLGHHAIIGWHRESSWPMIQGLSDKHPVSFMRNNDYIDLGDNICQALSERVNRFFIGQIECTLSFQNLTPGHLEYMRQIRNSAYEAVSIPVPDDRLPLLPLQEPIRRIRNINIYKYIGVGGFGIVGIGIDVDTGDVRAVKSVVIKDGVARRAAVAEALHCLTLSGQPGIMETICVCCDHHHCLEPDSAPEMLKVLSTCPDPDMIHFIFPCGMHDFRSSETANWDFWTMVGMFRGITTGLVTVHGKNLLHRDVTNRNMVAMLLKPPISKLIDFGKTVRGPTSKSKFTGPTHTQAPEIDGKTEYDSSADIWSAGLAFARVIDPTIVEMASYQQNSRQTLVWIRAVCVRLAEFGRQSPDHRRLAQVVQGMLRYEPHARFTARQVLAQLPVQQTLSAESDAETDIEERPTKVKKTSAPVNIVYSHGRSAIVHDEASSASIPNGPPLAQQPFDNGADFLDVLQQMRADISRDRLGWPPTPRMRTVSELSLTGADDLLILDSFLPPTVDPLFPPALDPLSYPALQNSDVASTIRGTEAINNEQNGTKFPALCPLDGIVQDLEELRKQQADARYSCGQA